MIFKSEFSLSIIDYNLTSIECDNDFHDIYNGGVCIVNGTVVFNATVSGNDALIK